ncbi:unnamed protein product [Dicrocoelium dendriticum]|nr:unnamed protein product [Dicrocoelium dendriticum]
MTGCYCVVVHAGAGYHARAKEESYNVLCSEACKASIEILSKGGSAVDGAAAAVAYLEDNDLTNSGFGSNLTLNGHVECDSGMMCGTSLRFAGAGAMPGIRNPIMIAKLMLLEQIRSPMCDIGRVSPSILCGRGAIEWAANKSPALVQHHDLVSHRAYSDWKKFRSLFDCSKSDVPDCIPHQPKRIRASHMDTVGAVCFDVDGNVASAVSSGGIALKHEGRIGQSSIYGCGCWAEQSPCSGKVGVVTSGTGEQLIRTQLAQRSAESLLNSTHSTIPDILTSTLKRDFLDSRFLISDKQRYAGVAGLFCPDNSKTIEVFFAHTTQSMSVGYFVDRAMTSPMTYVSRRSMNRPMRVDAFAHRIHAD